MRVPILALVMILSAPAFAQTETFGSDVLASLSTPHDYVQKRSSSYDRSGGNAGLSSHCARRNTDVAG